MPTVSLSVTKTVKQENNIVISSEQIKNSIGETLKDNNVDVQGSIIHPDISLNGSTFQQSSIYFNGIKVDDPQTAHNNFNVPVPNSDIQGIELLQNQGLAGGVNIVTKRPENEISEDFSFGDYNTQRDNVTVSHKWDTFANRLSFERSSSDGFTFDTDYDITDVSDRFEWSGSGLDGGLSLGYLKKDLGARGFYADFPSFEWTKTYLSEIDLNYEYEGILIKPEFLWKQNNDEFQLDVTRPGLSFNKSRTDIYSEQIAVLENNFTFTPNVTTEKMISSDLGDHQRDVCDIAADYDYSFTGGLNSTLGLRYNEFSGTSLLLPYFLSAYNISDSTKVHLLLRGSARQPSFTELYYHDAADTGNANLHFERATSYEAGADYDFLSLNLFLRDERNIIDWIKYNASDPIYQAANIGNARFYGYEIGAKKNLGVIKTSLKYTFTNSEKKADYISKYALQYAKYLLTGEVSYPVVWDIEHSITGLYKKRVTGEEYFVLDTKLAKKVPYGEYYVEVDNVLDKDYTEIPFVPMPPRILHAGLKLSF